MPKKAKENELATDAAPAMERRRFFRRLLGTGAIAGATTYLATAPEDWPLSRKDLSGLRSRPAVKPFTLPDFRVAKPTGSADIGVGHQTNLEVRLRAALDAVGGLKHYIQPGDIVLVKPNVAFDRAPNLGATSNPELLELLVHMLLVDCRAQEVRVADNPIESPADCFAKSGIRQAAEQGGGRIYLPDSNAFKMLHTPGAELIEHWWFFHRPFTNVDKVIGLSPVKDHNLCGASIGLKNWYGLLGGARNQFHQNIHGIISDLAIMIRPTLTIVDGSRVLMQNGPTGGDPSNVKTDNAVAVAVDPVAVDAWAYTTLLERGTEYPQYMYRAEEKGAGQVSYEGRVKEMLG